MKKSIQKHELRLQEKIQMLIEEINRAYGCSYIITEEKATANIKGNKLPIGNFVRK